MASTAAASATPPPPPPPSPCGDGRSGDSPASSQDPLVQESKDPLGPRGASSSSSPGDELRTRTALLLLTLIFLSSVTALAAVYFSFPHLEP